MNDFNQQLALVGAATTYSDVYSLSPDLGNVEASVVVGAIAGSGATLIATLQTSQDKVTWEDRNILPTFSATGTKKVRLNDPRLYFRVKLVLAGTTPTASVTLFAIGREGEGDASEMFMLQDAVEATGNGTQIDVVGQSSAVVAITGTFDGTVTFEGSLDDSNWFSVCAIRLDDGVIATTATATGLYRIGCAGLTSLRARVSTYVSGAITVKARTSLNDSGDNGTTWDRIRAGITAITSSFTGFVNSLVYTVYVASPTTRTNGQGGPLRSDSLGNVLSSLNTYLFGEDPNRNGVHVLRGGPPVRITTATTTIVKNSPGSLVGVYVEATLAAAVTFYNNASIASGDIIWVLDAGTTPGWKEYGGGELSNGAVAVTAGADRLVCIPSR